MEATDKKAFAETINGMAAIYSKQLSREQLTVYWNAIRDWDISAFQEAANHLMKTCEFFPKPYDFEQVRRLNRLSAYEAWNIAIAHASGGWRTSRYSGNNDVDRAIHSIGGYEALAMAPESQHQFLSKRFVDAYENLTDMAETREALPSFSENVRIGGAASMADVLKLTGGGS